MQRKSKDEREVIIERYRTSGLSVRAFCSGEGFADQTLRNWIGKSRNISKTDQGFVEVSWGNKKLSKIKKIQSPVKLPAPKYGVVIRFTHGASIEVFPESDRDTVAWIIDMFQRHA